VRKIVGTIQRINAIIQSTNTPIFQISVPLRSINQLVKFGQSGKVQVYILFSLVIIFMPIWIPVVISIFIFRIVIQFLIKRK
jgi:hypothetical protein